MERTPNSCPLEPGLAELTASIKVLAEQIDQMQTFSKDALNWHRQIIKWLLTVVCIIALGNSALDLGKKVFNEEMTKAAAAEAILPH